MKMYGGAGKNIWAGLLDESSGSCYVRYVVSIANGYELDEREVEAAVG
jgi:hypothetical protein